MKPHINKEKKERFFAQYWGQRVKASPESNGWTVGITNIGCSPLRDCWLELTPLSMITDEDAIEVGKIMNLSHLQPKSTLNVLVRDILSGRIDKKGNTLLWLRIYDYLRSKGYVLPWMGISVEEQIEAGWVKLKTEQS